METLSVAAARHESAAGKQAKVQGWVRTRRDSKGGFSFLEINDGSCQGNLQVVADGKLPKSHAEWLAGATEHPGSWWTDWSHWLESHAGRPIAAPKAYGKGSAYPAREPALDRVDQRVDHAVGLRRLVVAVDDQPPGGRQLPDAVLHLEPQEACRAVLELLDAPECRSGGYPVHVRSQDGVPDRVRRRRTGVRDPHFGR